MSDKEYLRPKVTQSKSENVKRVNGEFVNVDSYPDLAGFTAAGKWGKSNPSMSLESGGPSAVKGKPI